MIGANITFEELAYWTVQNKLVLMFNCKELRKELFHTLDGRYEVHHKEKVI